MAEQIGAYAYLECSAKTKEVKYTDLFIEWNFICTRQNSNQLCANMHTRIKSKPCLYAAISGSKNSKNILRTNFMR